MLVKLTILCIITIMKMFNFTLLKLLKTYQQGHKSVQSGHWQQQLIDISVHAHVYEHCRLLFDFPWSTNWLLFINPQQLSNAKHLA